MSGCYDRSNNENLDLFQCDSDPDGDLKSCCGRGDSCASNGLCVTSSNDTLTPYFINGCAEEDWSDPTCLRQCDDSGGNGVQPCGKGTYCCFGLGGCDCNNEDDVFSLVPVRIVTSIPIDASETQAAASSTSTMTAASSISGTTTTLSTTSSTGEPTSTSTAGSDSSESGSSSSSSSSSLPVGLGVGLGVGIPLIAIGVGLFWFFKRKRTPQPAAAKGQETTHYQPARQSELEGQHYRAELA
ncbi:hypothetical protein FZEAL_8616 [Fusarium zealandicum]|uniref:Mid2 domain-containing protein n=1 Tax=Fusarium zealandicum TaxID=1053134 RepID=A0A8H4UEF8_9HYPO|nr:hypothetical protein FZEAL_8616 [Fusarium zealandicum]